MANAKHRTPEHRAARAAMASAVEAGQARCTQPVCLMRSRVITPGSLWDAAHNRSGGYYGPAHARCNRSAGAVDGLRRRGFVPSSRDRATRRARPSTTGSWSSRQW